MRGVPQPAMLRMAGGCGVSEAVNAGGATACRAGRWWYDQVSEAVNAGGATAVVLQTLSGSWFAPRTLIEKEQFSPRFTHNIHSFVAFCPGSSLSAALRLRGCLGSATSRLRLERNQFHFTTVRLPGQAQVLTCQWRRCLSCLPPLRAPPSRCTCFCPCRTC